MQITLPKRFSAFLITQSLGAFNDNLFKMLLQLYVIQILVTEHTAGLISQANLVFTVPFVIFGPWSGYLADRFSKSTVMKVVKFAEIGVMLLGALAFYYGSVSMMLATLFLMATQSTFFGPAKYGYIPEQCETEAITSANSWVGMTTFLAIILGTTAGGILLSLHSNSGLTVAGYAIAFAAVGFLVSTRINPVKPAGTKEAFPVNPAKAILKDLTFLKSNHPIYLAALANGYFWMIGLIFQTNILIYGKQLVAGMDNANIMLSILPALIGIGVATGSMLAKRWSGKIVELGLVPLGGIGMAICGMLFIFTTSSYLSTCILLFITGVFGGLYTIPLISYIQLKAGAEVKGRIIAAAGMLNGLFLVLGTILHRVLAVELALNPATIFFMIGVMTIGVVYIICRIIPEYFLRFCTWLLTHTLYRIRIEGAENVPQEGPVLLAPNHISYTDAFMITASLQRFVRFVMLKKFYDMPIVNRLFKLAKMIPIDPSGGRKKVTESLTMARGELLDEQAVCIFPEGKISRSGEMNEFRRGCESIMDGIDCPIIPVYIHNPDGSFFRMRNGKWTWKWPRRLRLGSPITIYFGKAMPASARAADIEAAVREMSLQPAA